MGYHLSIEGIQKGYLFREKGKGLDHETELPRTPPPLFHGLRNPDSSTLGDLIINGDNTLVLCYMK